MRCTVALGVLLLCACGGGGGSPDAAGVDAFVGSVRVGTAAPFAISSKREVAHEQSPTIPKRTKTSDPASDDAVRVGVERAARTLQNIKGAWVQDQKVTVDNGKISEYRVTMKITFVLNE